MKLRKIDIKKNNYPSKKRYQGDCSDSRSITEGNPLAENAVVEIGGPFALGQWLADHHTSFQKQWDSWRLAIQSAGGVAGEDSVVLEVPKRASTGEDRALVFKYTGPAAVSPLIVSTAGDNLLEQAYALISAAAPAFFPLVISLPKQAEEEVDRPTIQ